LKNTTKSKTKFTFIVPPLKPKLYPSQSGLPHTLNPYI
jgi:hypothetical protein